MSDIYIPCQLDQIRQEQTNKLADRVKHLYPAASWTKKTETNKQNSRQGQTSISSRQSDQIRQNKKVDNLIPLATSLLKTKQKKIREILRLKKMYRAASQIRQDTTKLKN